MKVAHVDFLHRPLFPIPTPMKQPLDFRPHKLLRGGHLQTLAGIYWPTQLPEYEATEYLVDVSEGDQIALHDDCPADWIATSQVVLLIHGLAGCHGSGYMVRLAARLKRKGIRVFRMDMRGTGAAAGRAKLPGHAGRTEDAAAAIRFIADHCPEAPVTIVGFSMGGNIALGTLANASQHPIGNLRCGIAVSPPVDLSRCCRELRIGVGNFYDKYLIRHLKKRWTENGGEFGEAHPTSIYEFDDKVTAPISGYRDAEDYYADASSGPRLREISLPTKILAAKDDPIVAFGAIDDAERSRHVELFVTESGGHLGFFGSEPGQSVPANRWMDWKLESWISNWPV